MGREILTISVPTGSQEWHQIQMWKQSGANVSANILACMNENQVLVERLESLKAKIKRIAKLTDGGKAMEKEDWQIELGLWFE